jgi:hypothetical protein
VWKDARSEQPTTGVLCIHGVVATALYRHFLPAAVFCRDAYLRDGQGKARGNTDHGGFLFKTMCVSTTDSEVELGSNLGQGTITMRSGFPFHLIISHNLWTSYIVVKQPNCCEECGQFMQRPTISAEAVSTSSSVGRPASVKVRVTSPRADVKPRLWNLNFIKHGFSSAQPYDLQR